MTIISAQIANSDASCVILQTQERGAVAIQLPPLPDVSGGWRAVYDEWIASDHAPEQYNQPQ